MGASKRDGRRKPQRQTEEMYVQVLGCGSARPTRHHRPSAQALFLRGKVFLIDCGEGTQMQMMTYAVPTSTLHRIFITHLHGDHCLGLPGLLSTMSLMGFEHPVHVYGPIGIDQYVDNAVRFFCCDEDRDKIIVHVVEPSGLQQVYEDHSVTVSAFPMKHRVPCIGYRFDEKPLSPHLDKASADFYGVPISYYGRLKAGEDYVTEEGDVIPNARLTRPNRPAYSYAYCSDTVYDLQLAEYAHGVDLIYHETTFGDELADEAKVRMHSTTLEAARIARSAGAMWLMIGHYSARYNSAEAIEQLRLQSAHIHPNTIAADEGLLVSFSELRRRGE